MALRIARRAPHMYRSLTENPEAGLRDPLAVLDWVNLYALAVNEENASRRTCGDAAHQRAPPVLCPPCCTITPASCLAQMTTAWCVFF